MKNQIKLVDKFVVGFRFQTIDITLISIAIFDCSLLHAFCMPSAPLKLHLTSTLSSHGSLNQEICCTYTYHLDTISPQDANIKLLQNDYRLIDNCILLFIRFSLFRQLMSDHFELWLTVYLLFVYLSTLDISWQF